MENGLLCHNIAEYMLMLNINIIMEDSASSSTSLDLTPAQKQDNTNNQMQPGSSSDPNTTIQLDIVSMNRTLSSPSDLQEPNPTEEQILEAAPVS
eukprot:7729884-Ditylum_brightwellii.AAC.1